MEEYTFKKPNILEYVEYSMAQGHSEEEALFLYDVEYSDTWESEDYYPEDDPHWWDDME